MRAGVTGDAPVIHLSIEKFKHRVEGKAETEYSSRIKLQYPFRTLGSIAIPSPVPPLIFLHFIPPGEWRDWISSAR